MKSCYELFSSSTTIPLSVIFEMEKKIRARKVEKKLEWMEKITSNIFDQTWFDLGLTEEDGEIDDDLGDYLTLDGDDDEDLDDDLVDFLDNPFEFFISD